MHKSMKIFILMGIAFFTNPSSYANESPSSNNHSLPAFQGTVDETQNRNTPFSWDTTDDRKIRQSSANTIQNSDSESMTQKK